MKKSPLVAPVLLCGGSGTRLWPLSRRSYPKQFVPLIGPITLFQSSAQRLSGIGFAPPVIVTGSEFRFIVTEQLADVGIQPADILIEPSARNTAPAILAAAIVLHARDAEALMLVAPSDHVIPDVERFQATVSAAVEIAISGQLVTFGIRPDRAETGYGWLELSHFPDDDFSPIAQPLVQFSEKPDQTTAQRLLDGGKHLWNAGIFLFRADQLLKAFKQHQPDMLELVQASVDHAQRDLSFTRLEPNAWSKVDDISIDYAIMEKAKNLSVVPYGGFWSDLGGWEAIWREGAPDRNGVVTQGGALAIDCADSLLRAESETQEVVGIGLDNIIAVAMPDAVLIASKDRAQDVKLAILALKAKGAKQAEFSSRHHRPWGWFESLATGLRFQVKRIVVHPGAALSLQSHHHRAEHWIVVEGTARITIDDKVQLLTENQSIYIPVGAVHRLENPGKFPVTLVEVQTGSYFGEDDIVRYADMYDRYQKAKG